MRFTRLALLPLLLLSTACGGGSSSSSTTPTFAEMQAGLDAITATGVTGVLLRLGGPFGSEVLTSGVADRQSGRPPTATDTFRIASISKAYSGVVILDLVRDGLVGLDDTVERWLPGALPEGDRVHIRQLLDHTSGVFNYTDDETFQTEFGNDPLRVWTPAELVAVAAGHRLNFEPGTAYAYSNTDNILIGLIAEAATGDSYAALLQSSVFGPLGLQHTALPTTTALPDPFIHGFFYHQDGTVQDVSEALSPTGSWASGAIISTATDLARFVGALVGGDLYGQALREQARRTVAGDSQPPGPPGPGTNQAGLGLFRYDAACGTMWGHTGRFPGYRTYALATPNGRRTLVLTLNEEPAPAAADAPILAALELAVCRLIGL
jgi:D-alanyl-D-alanine carboxypeptidase